MILRTLNSIQPSRVSETIIPKSIAMKKSDSSTTLRIALLISLPLTYYIVNAVLKCNLGMSALFDSAAKMIPSDPICVIAW